MFIAKKDYDKLATAYIGVSITKERASELDKKIFHSDSVSPIFLKRDGKLVVVGYVDPTRGVVWSPEYDRYIEDFVDCDGNSVLHPTRPKIQPPTRQIRQMKESKIIGILTRELVLEGWIIRRRKQLKFGSPDLIATKGNEFMIVEAKICAKTNFIAHALGQLLLYKYQVNHPNPRLAIALPSRPELFLQQVLADFDVEIIVIDELLGAVKGAHQNG